MPCCSSFGLPIQGYQLPMGPRCSILSDEALHASGLEPECTVCLQPQANHPRGKHIAKDCKFCHQQASGDTATDDLDLVEDGDIQSRLACITQENHAINVQLSQLTELVHQLLSQAAQATPQPANISNQPPVLPPAEGQSPGTSGTTLSLPPPSWSHSRDTGSGDSPSNHWAVLLSPLGQPPATVRSNPLLAVIAPIALPGRQAPTTDMQPQLPWASPVSFSILC